MPNGKNKSSVWAGLLLQNYSFKKAVYMFEGMEIAETIYEGVLEPSD